MCKTFAPNNRVTVTKVWPLRSWGRGMRNYKFTGDRNSLMLCNPQSVELSFILLPARACHETTGPCLPLEEAGNK